MQNLQKSLIEALKTRAKWEQEIRSLLKIDDSFKKIVITSNAPDAWYDQHGILTMNIYDFLLNPDSLNM